MTWDWNIAKFIASTALSLVSTINPAFFVTAPAGEALAELIKQDRYKALNSSTESFGNKQSALRIIELTKDYQVDTAFGGVGSVVGEVVGTVGPMITKEIGQEAAVEIASHGGLTQAARELKSLGQWVAKCESWIAGSTATANFASGFSPQKKYEKEIDEIIDILRARESRLATLQGNWEALKKGREYFLQLNIGNIGLYIEKEEDIEKHRQVNEIINRCLSTIREFQKEMHDNNQCVASECRFH